jgi:hypothetical protein
MDSNKFSTQIERLGVVETGRRRGWTNDEKLKIVLESMQSPRAVSSTARRAAPPLFLRLRFCGLSCQPLGLESFALLENAFYAISCSVIAFSASTWRNALRASRSAFAINTF